MTEKTFDGGLFDVKDDCYLGLDPSLTGFALTALGANCDAHMTWVYRSDKRDVDRLIDIDKWLEARIWHLCRGRKILDASIEGGVVQSQSSFVLGELAGVVKTRLNRLPINQARYPLIVPPMSLKKFVAGKGSGVKKNEMLLHTYKRWNVEFTDDNAADSYGLAQVVKAYHHVLPDGLPKYQQEVLAKLSYLRGTNYVLPT